MDTAQDTLRRLRELQTRNAAGGAQILESTITTKEPTMNGQQPGQSGLQPMQPMQPGQAPVMMPQQPQHPQQPAMMAPPMFAPQMQQQMQPPMQALPQATGVAVQIEVETPSGKATAFLHYGPEWASSSAAMKQLIGALQMAGFPVKTWTPKGQRGGGW